MGIGSTLAVLAGLAGLLALLMILVAVDARNEPEATPGLVAALFSVPAAAAMTVLAGTAAVLFAWYGATRRALILAAIAGIGIIGMCGWLASVA